MFRGDQTEGKGLKNKLYKFLNELRYAAKFLKIKISMSKI